MASYHVSFSIVDEIDQIAKVHCRFQIVFFIPEDLDAVASDLNPIPHLPDCQG